MQNEILIIYHNNCWDGMAAAYAAQKVFKENADYLAMNYSDPLPIFNKYTKVYILDYSFKLPQMIQILENNPQVHFVNIDHHSGALELKILQNKYWNFVFKYDEDESGATLSWLYFNSFPSVRFEPPLFYKYIKDRDLWRFELNNSKEVNAFIRSKPKNFSSCEELEQKIKNSIENVIISGECILQYDKTLIEEAIKNVHFVDLLGYIIPVVNSSQFFSEIAEQLYIKYNTPFAAVYFNRTDGKRQWSLRSPKSFNVCEEIAKKKGGSGHPQSSGFEEDCSIPIKIIDFNK